MTNYERENEISADEVIKGLNELSQYTGFQEKYIQVLNATLDLINRQKSEIERLKKEVSVARDAYISIQDRYGHTKAEAYKEFAERLKLHSYIMSDESQTGIINIYSVVTVNRIDNLLKEMVGGRK